jgi:predicted RND superfamily exporter protein
MMEAARSADIIKRYVANLLVDRWWVVAISVFVVASFAIGLKNLRFSNDYKVFFDPSDPYLKALEEIHNVYTDNDPVVFVVTPRDGKVFTRTTLRTIEKLTREAWTIPYVQRVDSLQNFQYSRSENDDLVVSDLYRNADALSDADMDRIRQIALAEPLLLGRIINPSASVTGVFASFHVPGIDRQKEIPEIMQKARALRDELMRENPNVEIRLAGAVVISQAFTEASSRDIGTLGPLMFVLIAATLWVLLKSALTAFASLMVILFTIAGTMGLAGWLGFVLSPASITAPTILLTVAVADSVHVLVDFLNDLEHIRVDQHRDPIRRARFLAIIGAIRQTIKPVFVTTLTTAIGFLTLNFSDSPPFRDLGNIVALGVVIAFVLSMTFLPALLAILPIKQRKAQGGKALTGTFPILYRKLSLLNYRITFSITKYETGKRVSSSFSRLASFVIARRKALALILAVIVSGLGVAIPQNDLNDDVIKYFSEETEFRKDWHYTTTHLTGLYTLEYSLRAKEAGGINDPEYLKVVEDFAAWFKEQPETMHVDSLVDIHKRLNQNMNGDDPAWYRLPDNQELAAQYLLLYEMSLPPGLELNDRINIDKSASRFVATVHNLSSKEMLALEKRADDWLKKNAPPYMQAQAGSTPLMFSHIGQSNMQGLLEGTAIEFVVIAAILMFVLRSFGLGLLSLIPNIVPAAMAFGFWALINGQINLGLSVVANMTLGIVVDDTVHFLSNYTDARRRLGLSRERAIHYTFSHVGKAMAISTAVLAIGFGTLTLSTYELNAQMGLLTAITILFALLGDLFLLPSLLLLGGKEK